MIQRTITLAMVVASASITFFAIAMVAISS